MHLSTVELSFRVAINLVRPSPVLGGLGAHSVETTTPVDTTALCYFPKDELSSAGSSVGGSLRLLWVTQGTQNKTSHSSTSTIPKKCYSTKLNGEFSTVMLTLGHTVAQNEVYAQVPP